MPIVKNIFSVFPQCDYSRRIEIIDFLRGGAMILVLLHHSGFPFGKWILPFHMPLFFVLSGLTESLKRKENNESFRGFFHKRFKRLIIPYLAFEIINLIIWGIKCYIFKESFSLLSAFSSIILCINTDMYTGLCGRLWFLPCMFISSIILWIILKISKQMPALLCATGILFFLSWITVNVIPFRLPFAIDTSFMATAFILIGYCGKEVFLYIIGKGHVLTDLILLVLMLGLLYQTYRTDKGIMEMYINKFGDYLYSILGALGGVISYFIIAKDLYYAIRKIGLINSIVLWYSYNSLATFPVHLEIKCVLLLFNIPWLKLWWVLFLIMLIMNIPIVNILTNYLPFLLGQKRKVQS